jgi:hypothetical protein
LQPGPLVRAQLKRSGEGDDGKNADTKGCSEFGINDVKRRDANTSRNEELFTASRLLKDWELKGAVEKSRGKVLIRCPEKLLAA